MNHTVISATNPASRSAASWQARLAALKSRDVPEADPRIVEARSALSYHRVAKAIDAEAGQLTAPGGDTGRGTSFPPVRHLLRTSHLPVYQSVRLARV